MSRGSSIAQGHPAGNVSWPARMAELAYAMVSNTIVRKDMRVRIPLRARTGSMDRSRDDTWTGSVLRSDPPIEDRDTVPPAHRDVVGVHLCALGTDRIAGPHEQVADIR
jgi:hypothetical protein